MYTPTYKECFDLTQTKDEFKMFDRGDYVVFDYVVAKTDTFDCKVSREMRGIAFNKATRQIISRPLHKFFNLGERAETQEKNIDFTKTHQIVEKLDGSMIRTINLGNGKYRLGTRAGVTDIAMMAEEFVAGCHPDSYDTFIHNMLMQNQTAIFEFCSRKNRVVIDHPEDRLVLLAVRDNITGVYMQYELLKFYADLFGMDLAGEMLNEKSSLSELADAVTGLVGQEGVIVQFSDGFRIKIKAEDYLRKHGALDGFRSDKRTLELVLGNDLDDVLPLLDDEMKDRIVRYRDATYTVISYYNSVIHEFVCDIASKTTIRKEQAALIFASELMKPVASDLFTVLDGKSLNIRENLIEASNQKMREILEKIGLPLWSQYK